MIPAFPNVVWKRSEIDSSVSCWTHSVEFMVICNPKNTAIGFCLKSFAEAVSCFFEIFRFGVSSSNVSKLVLFENCGKLCGRLIHIFGFCFEADEEQEQKSIVEKAHIFLS